MDKDPAAMTLSIEMRKGVRVLRVPVPGNGELIVAIDPEGVSLEVMDAADDRVVSTYATTEEITKGSITDAPQARPQG